MPYDQQGNSISQGEMFRRIAFSESGKKLSAIANTMVPVILLMSVVVSLIVIFWGASSLIGSGSPIRIAAGIGVILFTSASGAFALFGSSM